MKRNPTGAGRYVYLVEDWGHSPGKIYAIFDSEDEAELFAELLDEECQVVTRTLFRGQPSVRGYND